LPDIRSDCSIFNTLSSLLPFPAFLNIVLECPGDGFVHIDKYNPDVVLILGETFGVHNPDIDP
jgi:hypothetical protein